MARLAKRVRLSAHAKQLPVVILGPTEYVHQPPMLTRPTLGRFVLGGLANGNHSAVPFAGVSLWILWGGKESQDFSPTFDDLVGRSEGFLIYFTVKSGFKQHHL